MESSVVSNEEIVTLHYVSSFLVILQRAECKNIMYRVNVKRSPPHVTFVDFSAMPAAFV